MTRDLAAREHYSNAANPNYEARLARHSAQETAPFFLKELQPGMRVLDCGCGPGAITVGLAEAVAPGDVVGVDIQQSQVDMGRRLAVERGTGNVAFQQGSIYELPFPDASFDAVSAFHLLFHLREPMRALREMRRVLKPSGVIGIRDPDGGGSVFEPWSASAAAVFECNRRGHEFNGGDPAFGRKQRRLLYEAGFERVEGASVAVTSGTPAALEQLAEAICLRLTGPAYLEAIVGQGLAARTELDMMLDGFRAWTRRPDAFAVQLFCTAVGWAPE